jgi:cytochrome P450
VSTNPMIQGNEESFFAGDAPVGMPGAGTSGSNGCPHHTAALGASYNPFDPDFLQDPHKFFTKARREAPVCYNPIFNMWLVTGYAEVLKVCEDTTLFSSKNKVDPPNDIHPEVLEILRTEGFPVVLQLFNSDPPEHDRISALVNQGFSAQHLQAAVPGMYQLAHQLVDAFPADRKVELRAAYADPFPLSTILDFIGVPAVDHAQVKVWDDWWARLFTSAHAIDEQMHAVRQVVEYQHYFNNLINDRRARPKNDLTSRLVAASVEGAEPLRNDEMIWQFMGLLAAGHATTTDALTNLLLIILREPGRWNYLHSHREEIPSYIDEGLRFANPVLGLPRVATREVELGGVTIPEGGQVLVSFCSANRDDRLTPHADAFNPSREGVTRHLGFGKGLHYCVGARMSRNMMRVAIEVLLDRVPTLHLEEHYSPEHTVHPFLWGLARLPLRWDSQIS